jgi:hypothetical protein
LRRRLNRAGHHATGAILSANRLLDGKPRS